MTTTREAEKLLFNVSVKVTAETSSFAITPERRRVDATYCPICGGWVEIRLQPVRLHCTGCGQEAKP